MKNKLIQPFIDAVEFIFQEFSITDCTAGDIFEKSNETALGDVTGIIGLTGSPKGTVAITFNEKMILKIVSAMFKEEVPAINDMVTDAAGELTNMIAGRAIEKLVAEGINLELSVPTIIHGKNHRVVHHTNGPKLAVPFSAEEGSFIVEVSFESKK